MDYEAFINMPNAPMPQEIQALLRQPGGITPTAFEAKNTILSNPQLQEEIGCAKLDNGDWLVSMTCPMPGVSKEMVDWWFWWHPQADERYQLWYPGEHFSISYAKKNAAYFSSAALPPFQSNSQYPVEQIGKQKMPLRIDFISPREFGFCEEAMRENGIATIVCGHVGALGGLIWHTEMAHIFRQTEEGLFLISRFWLGNSLKSPLLRKRLITAETARSMAAHCCVEYRNFAVKIPQLFKAGQR